MNGVLSKKMLARLNNKDNAINDSISKNDLDIIVQELEVYHTEILAQNNELLEKQKSLYEVQKEFSTLFFSSPIPYFILDKKFNIIVHNNEAQKLFQIGKRLNKFTIFVKKEYTIKLLDWLATKEYKNKDLELEMRCFDKTTRRFSLKAIEHPTRDEHLFFSLLDIQEAYELKNNLQKKVDIETKKNISHLEMLQEKSRLASMGELIDIIIHQWMSPLTVIKLRTEMLKNDYLNEDVDLTYVNYYSKEQIKSIDYLISTLKEFRDFLRPKGQLEKINLNKLLGNVKILLKDVLLKNKIFLDIKIEKDLFVKVYPNEFLHVFINLINNSIEAFENQNNEKNVIKIYAKAQLNSIVLYFEDNAGGISEYKISHIFDKNFTTKEYGTGIGLYLVKNILEKINATISAENIKNGLKFKIFILK